MVVLKVVELEVGIKGTQVPSLYCVVEEYRSNFGGYIGERLLDVLIKFNQKRCRPYGPQDW